MEIIHDNLLISGWLLVDGGSYIITIQDTPLRLWLSDGYGIDNYKIRICQVYSDHDKILANLVICKNIEDLIILISIILK